MLKPTLGASGTNVKVTKCGVSPGIGPEARLGDCEVEVAHRGVGSKSEFAKGKPFEVPARSGRVAQGKGGLRYGMPYDATYSSLLGWALHTNCSW